MSGSAAKDCGPSPANMNRAPRTVRIILRLIGFPPFGLGDVVHRFQRLTTHCITVRDRVADPAPPRTSARCPDLPPVCHCRYTHRPMISTSFGTGHAL